jgi:hypothetical protein
MLHALISIWVIAMLAVAASIATRRKICPICAGVFLTWLWMLIGYYVFAYNADVRVIALLMGGSVVGAAYTLEKRLPPSRSPGLWKLIVVPVGFAAVHGVLTEQLSLIITGLIVLLSAAWYFLRGGQKDAPHNRSVVRKLEDQLKNCC